MTSSASRRELGIKGVIMRLTTVLAVMLLAVTPASAQNQQQQYPYGLDPYSPSDAELLRTYGATLVAQTPLLELRKLDPYVPSQAALRRQLGGAMPLGWLYPFIGAPTFAPLTPFPRAEAIFPTGSSMVVIIVPPANRFGRYGSPFSPDSINNPFGVYGNPFSPLLSDPIQVYDPQIFYPWQWQPYPPVYSRFRRPLRGWGY